MNVPGDAPSAIENLGAWIDSLRQTGHLPGLVSRPRFSKTNPHFTHSAGWTWNTLPLRWSDVRMCSRWPATSFSGIPTIPVSVGIRGVRHDSHQQQQEPH
jgi:hypothetical protein